MSEVISPYRILFIESVHDILEERLTAAGFACEHRYTANRDEILRDLPQYAGVVIRSRVKVDREFMDHGVNLQFIARSGSGLENIDTDYALEKGIRLFNSPEGNRDAVGEHVAGMLLSLMNRLHLADREVRQGKWLREENRGLEISGKTVGIIGYGQMGSSVAEKLSGFGCELIAFDKYLNPQRNTTARLTTLEELQERADIISLHLPLNKETMHFADTAFFASFHKPIWFVNTARGKNVDTKALADALRTGKVRGACLDVLEYEKASLEGLDTSEMPPVLRYLFESENVLLTPHVAGWTAESYYKLSSVLADKILAYRAAQSH